MIFEDSFKLPRVERIFRHHSLCATLIALLFIRLPILKAVASLLNGFSEYFSKKPALVRSGSYDSFRIGSNLGSISTMEVASILRKFHST